MTPGRPAVRYYVTVKGVERLVEIAERPDGLSVQLDGEPVEADLLRLHESRLHSLLLDGHSREMILEREGDRVWVSLDGERMDVRVQDEVSRALAAIGGEVHAGPAEILAPMPGIVASVPVSPGDEVTVGQPVVVVEAMKMQNELVAESEGIVDTVRVAPGDTVSGGDVLVTLRPRPAAEA